MSLYDLSKKGPKFPMDTKRIYHRDAQIDSGKKVSTSPWTIGLSTKNPEKLNDTKIAPISGWFTFNALEPVHTWSRSRGNGKSPSLELLLENSKLRVKTPDGKLGFVTPSGELSEPHLLIYSEDQRHLAGRGKRSPNSPASKRKRRRQRGRRRKQGQKKACQLNSYYVDFKVKYHYQNIITDLVL